MTEHTPGPWDIVPAGIEQGLFVRAPHCPDGPKLVCRVLDSEEHPAEPNARLIAASPDLFEALEFLIPAAEECMLLAGEGTLSEDDEVILDIARAAVAQAKGETPC